MSWMKPAYIFQMISDEHERDGIAVLFIIE